MEQPDRQNSSRRITAATPGNLFGDEVGNLEAFDMQLIGALPRLSSGFSPMSLALKA
jgi:hypothetical protein